jgi:Protein of unknown function (DUF1552)
MRKCNRRDFAKAAALSALFAPFVRLVTPVQAQATTGPAKYLFIFFSNGTEPGVWSPRGSTSSSLVHSTMTEPLAPLDDNLVIIEKLDSMGTANSHGGPGGLTGAGFSGQPLISLDQYASDQLQELGVSTQIPNLVLGGVSSETQSTFYRSNRPLTPIFSPSSAYAAIFGGGGVDLPGGTGEAAADARLRRRQSMLDVLNGELTSLSQTLGAEERVKLDAHAASLRQLEERILKQIEARNSPPTVVVQCTTPSDPGAGSDAMANSVLHMDLAINAFACDLTRVAAVQFGHHQSTQVDIPEVGAAGDWHNGFLHSDNPRTRLVNVERWLATQFVAAAQRLKDTPAPDGNGSLFDQTLMLWARDMGDAVVHDGSDMRFVLSGGAGGYLKTGGCYIDGAGQAHSKVLFNALEALGITDTSGFGDDTTDREPIADLRA